jgi:hypothetical protein
MSDIDAFNQAGVSRFREVARAEARATLDAIRAEIADKHRMAEIKQGRLDPAANHRRLEKQHGIIAGLHTALAIIDRHTSQEPASCRVEQAGPETQKEPPPR